MFKGLIKLTNLVLIVMIASLAVACKSSVKTEDELPKTVTIEGLTYNITQTACKANSECTASGAVCYKEHCAEPEESSGCSSDAECPSEAPVCNSNKVCEPKSCDPACAGGSSCVNGTCMIAVSGCTVDADCAATESCVSSVCTAKVACTNDIDCKGTERCGSDEYCEIKPECDKAEDCLNSETMTCLNGKCFEGSKCTATSNCSTGSICVLNKCIKNSVIESTIALNKKNIVMQSSTTETSQAANNKKIIKLKELKDAEIKALNETVDKINVGYYCDRTKTSSFETSKGAIVPLGCTAMIYAMRSDEIEKLDLSSPSTSTDQSGLIKDGNMISDIPQIVSLFARSTILEQHKQDVWIDVTFKNGQKHTVKKIIDFNYPILCINIYKPNATDSANLDKLQITCIDKASPEQSIDGQEIKPILFVNELKPGDKINLKFQFSTKSTFSIESSSIRFKTPVQLGDLVDVTGTVLQAGTGKQKITYYIEPLGHNDFTAKFDNYFGVKYLDVNDEKITNVVFVSSDFGDAKKMRFRIDAPKQLVPDSNGKYQGYALSDCKVGDPDTTDRCDMVWSDYIDHLSLRKGKNIHVTSWTNSTELAVCLSDMNCSEKQKKNNLKKTLAKYDLVIGDLAHKQITMGFKGGSEAAFKGKVYIFTNNHVAEWIPTTTNTTFDKLIFKEIKIVDTKGITLSTNTCNYALNESTLKIDMLNDKNCSATNTLSCPEGMAFITGGIFMMGSELDKVSKPVHPVYISPFCMDKYEYSESYNENDATSQRLAISTITWSEANSKCTSQGKRLPSEAEWEYAAKGKNSTNEYGTVDGTLSTNNATYNISDSDDDDVSFIFAAQHDPNDYDLYDMAGDVSEWVADSFKDYTIEPRSDYTEGDGKYKVVRDGSWKTTEAEKYKLRSTYRAAFPAETKNDTIGFRCAVTPTPTK